MAGNPVSSDDKLNEPQPRRPEEKSQDIGSVIQRFVSDSDIAAKLKKYIGHVIFGIQLNRAPATFQDLSKTQYLLTDLKTERSPIFNINLKHYS